MARNGRGRAASALGEGMRNIGQILAKSRDTERTQALDDEDRRLRRQAVSSEELTQPGVNTLDVALPELNQRALVPAPAMGQNDPTAFTDDTLARIGNAAETNVPLRFRTPAPEAMVDAAGAPLKGADGNQIVMQDRAPSMTLGGNVMDPRGARQERSKMSALLAAEDRGRSKAYAAEDYELKQGQEADAYALTRGREKHEYDVAEARKLAERHTMGQALRKVPGLPGYVAGAVEAGINPGNIDDLIRNTTSRGRASSPTYDQAMGKLEDLYYDPITKRLTLSPEEFDKRARRMSEGGPMESADEPLRGPRLDRYYPSPTEEPSFSPSYEGMGGAPAPSPTPASTPVAPPSVAPAPSPMLTRNQPPASLRPPDPGASPIGVPSFAGMGGGPVPPPAMPVTQGAVAAAAPAGASQAPGNGAADTTGRGAAVAKVRELKAKGMTPQQIIAEMNRQGFKIVPGSSTTR